MNYNNSNTTQRFYDIFINNICLIEVTFVAWKSLFFVSNFSFQPRGENCEFFHFLGTFGREKFHFWLENDFRVERMWTVDCGGKFIYRKKLIARLTVSMIQPQRLREHYDELQMSRSWFAWLHNSCWSWVLKVWFSSLTEALPILKLVIFQHN